MRVDQTEEQGHGQANAGQHRKTLGSRETRIGEDNEIEHSVIRENIKMKEARDRENKTRRTLQRKARTGECENRVTR